MSEKLAQLEKKGGGAMNETVLWTNPSPSNTFLGQTVTLSDNVNNYKYIKVEWRNSTTNNNTNYVIFPIDLWVNSTSATGKNRCVIASHSSNNLYARGILYASATSATFSSCYPINGTATNDNLAIPTQIIGLK